MPATWGVRRFDCRCLAECWLLFYFGSAVFLTFLPVSARRVSAPLWRLRFCWSCFCAVFFFLFSGALPHTRHCASLIFVFLFRFSCPLCASHHKRARRARLRFAFRHFVRVVLPRCCPVCAEDGAFVARISSSSSCMFSWVLFCVRRVAFVV